MAGIVRICQQRHRFRQHLCQLAPDYVIFAYEGPTIWSPACWLSCTLSLQICNQRTNSALAGQYGNCLTNLRAEVLGDADMAKAYIYRPAVHFLLSSIWHHSSPTLQNRIVLQIRWALFIFKKTLTSSIAKMTEIIKNVIMVGVRCLDKIPLFPQSMRLTTKPGQWQHRCFDL